MQSQIKALRAQLKDLQKERDDKIAAVLTPEQKKQAADAAKKAKEEPAKPAEKTPPSASRWGHAAAGDTPAK